MQIGIGTPWNLALLSAQEQRAHLAAAADAGVDFVFTADHVSFHDGTGIDALIRLASVGAMEPRLDLHAGVLLLALRHPMVVARQIATFCETAPGRLTVGVGVGGEDRHEIEVCGVDPATRGRRTDAALELVRALLAGHTVDGDGEFYDFERGRIRPAPVPPVPFVVGGRSDAALRRAGRLGDGWLAAWCSPRRFGEGVARVAEVADGSDRAAVEWRHGLQAWVGVGVDPQQGRTHVADRMQRFYKLDFDLFARYTPTGTPEQIAEFLVPYVEAGATSFSLMPCGESWQEEVEAVGEIKRLMARR